MGENGLHYDGRPTGGNTVIPRREINVSTRDTTTAHLHLPSHLSLFLCYQEKSLSKEGCCRGSFVSGRSLSPARTELFMPAKGGDGLNLFSC